MAPQLASALASVTPLVHAGALPPSGPPQRAACPFTPQQLDVVRGVMQKVALQPDLLALPELTFVNEFLSCVGGRGCANTLESMLKGLKGAPQAVGVAASPMQPPPAPVSPAPAPAVAAPAAFPPAPAAATVNEMESMASVLSVLDEISSQSSTPRSTASATPTGPSFASAQPPPPLCLQMLSQSQVDGQSPTTSNPSTPSPSTLPFPLVNQAGQLARPQSTTPTQAAMSLQNILVPCAGAASGNPAAPPSAASGPTLGGATQPLPAGPSNPSIMGLLQPVTNQGGDKYYNAPGTDGSMKDDEKANIDPRKYKTRMCRNWVKEGRCTYEHTCCFAHGEAELRNSAANICVLSSLAYFKSKQEGEEE